jgi:hypothetical protein
MTQALDERTRVVTQIIDGDGHVYECDAELYPYLSAKYDADVLRTYYLFPTLDGWRRGIDRRMGLDTEGWLRFLDTFHISQTVLYPTIGLGFGFVRDVSWAVDLARAYNDWLSDAFLRVSPRFKGVALLPVQDPKAAAEELRRAVRDLGMVGGLLPGAGLPLPYGHHFFDPLYEAAQALDTMLAVHGAPRQGLGPDYINADNGMGFVLAHPLSQIIHFVSMVFDGTFDRFPALKVAFLEAGCGWVPYFVERIDRRARERLGRRIASEQLKDHPIYFHAELDEAAIPQVISLIGDDRLLYASDYPHDEPDEIEERLEGFLARKDVSQAAKQNILCHNIKRIYGMA